MASQLIPAANNTISALMEPSKLLVKLGHPRSAIPQTQARNEQKAATLKGVEAVLLDLLRVGDDFQRGLLGEGQRAHDYDNCTE